MTRIENMTKIDKLLEQAKEKAKFHTKDNYDFSKLSMGELKELAYGDPTDTRLDELIDKMR